MTTWKIELKLEFGDNWGALDIERELIYALGNHSLQVVGPIYVTKSRKQSA